MAPESNESTRVMPTGGAAPSAGATQMGGTIVCPVCKSSNSGLEAYCAECGFLLASVPGQFPEAVVESAPGYELVDTATGRRFGLRQGTNTVGRENSDVLLMDGTVSRRHAVLTVEGDLVMIIDVGSTNGTKVNGTRITPNHPTTVTPGSTLQFGNTILTLPALSGEAAPAEPTISVQVETPPAAVTEDQTLVAAPSIHNVPQPDLSQSEPPPAAEAPVAWLKPNGGSAVEVLIRPGTVSIGRRPGNTYLIPGDPYVSGRHAEVYCDNTGCYLTDVGSTNGTVVNGTRLEPGVRQLLLDGDEVMIGQGSYVFETLEPPADMEDEAQDVGAPHLMRTEPDVE
jgi:pSer/pThr/pTyr-binding forkhead associated (FHA) protein